MIERFRYIIVFAGLFLFASHSVAKSIMPMNNGDSITVVRKGVKEEYVAANKGYDALKYSMQRRYRHPDFVKYSNSSLFSHMYIGTTLAYQKIAAQKDFEFTSASSYGIVLGKDISKSHSLSLLMLYGKYPQKQNDFNLSLTKMAIQLNHHFNFSRYYFGHNPYRVFELASTIGVGYQNYEMWDIKESSLYILFGLKGLLRIGSNLILAIEPHVSVADKSYDLSSIDYTSYRYNFKYGVGTSLLYEVKNELDNIKRHDNEFLFPRNYFFIGSGVSYTNTNVQLVDGFGPNVVLGYGRWLARHFAMQFSAGYAGGVAREKTIKANKQNKTPKYTAFGREQYAFGRGELLFNVFTTAKNGSEIRNDFSLNLLGGYEYGMQWRYTPASNKQVNCYYSGFTGALNLKYHIDRNTSIFFEPRITFVNYSTPYNPPYDYMSVDEKLTRYSVTAGMELAADKKSVNRLPKEEDGFVPEYSIYLFGGQNYLFERIGYYGDDANRYNVGLSIEHQPYRLFGYRVMFDYSTYGFNNIINYSQTINKKKTSYNGLWNYKYHVLSLGLNLKFDVTNAIFGHNPSRRWRSSFYLGPVATKIVKLDKAISSDEPRAGEGKISSSKNYNDKVHFGLYAAYNSRYNITPSWSVFGEMGLRVWKNEFMHEEELDYNPVKALNFIAGVGYNFNSAKNLKESKYLFPRNYLFYGAGVGYVNTDIQLVDGLGPQISFGFGRWLSRRYALQIAFNYSGSNTQQKKIAANKKLGRPAYKVYGKSQYVSLRSEVVYNFFTTIKNCNDIKNDFSLNVLAGFELGAYWKYLVPGNKQRNGMFKGGTAALNFKYYVDDTYAFYFEPRVSISDTSEETAKKNNKLSYRYSVAAGVELPMDKTNFRRYKKEENEFVPEYEFSLFAGLNYLFARTSYEGYDINDCNWGATFGYQPNKYIGYRLMFDYSTYGFNNICKYTETVNKKTYSYDGLWNYKYHMLTLGLNFKLDVTNTFFGYKPDRRWHSSVFLGPIASKIVKMEQKIAPNELLLPGSRVKLNKKYNDDIFLGFYAAHNTRYAITKNFSLFSELGIRVYKNEILAGEDLDYNPVKALTLQFGVNYRIKNRLNNTGKGGDDYLFSRNYFFNSVGVQYTNTNVPLLNGLGPQISFGLGRWITRRLALQMSFGYSAGNAVQKYIPGKMSQGRPTYLAFGNMQYAFMRGEVVTNLFTTIKSRKETYKDFSINLITGIEYGRRWKYAAISGQKDVTYKGFTGGLNFKYHPDEQVAFFVEPRFAIIEELARYNVSAGIEYSFDNEIKKRKHIDDYATQISLSFMGGANYLLRRTSYDGKSGGNKSFGITAEYQPFKLLGARVMFDYSTYGFNNVCNYTEFIPFQAVQHNRRLWQYTYHTISLGLNAKFDITNAIYGYNSDRKWNSAFYAGPIITKFIKLDSEMSNDELRYAGSELAISKKYNDKLHFGMYAAYNCQYKLTDRLNLLGELGIKVYKNEFMNENLDYNPIRDLSFQIGISYNIK